MTMPLYNIRFILLISASFITIFSSIAIYFCLPILISHVMRTQLSIAPNSGSFQGWRFNSVIDRIYLYNITNLDELIGANDGRTTESHKPIPKIKQIGPFVYRQDREKFNINFDPTNETVSYDQSKRWFFLPDSNNIKTIEDLNKTWVNHINIPLAGTSLNPEYAEFIDPIVQEFDLKLFLNHSVNILLFEGYFDILMEQAKSNGQIDVDRFGWLYNQNNSVTRGIRIFTGPSNATLDKLGAIDMFNATKHFDIWHNNNTEPKDTSNVKCNEFRLSSAGEFFPPSKHSIISHNNHQQNQRDNQKTSYTDLMEKLELSILDENKTMRENISNSDRRSNYYANEKTISLFMPDLCRTFKLFYNHSYDFKGLSVDRYVANQLTYDYTSEIVNTNYEINYTSSILTNPNRCYCIYNETTKLTSCPPNGMMDLFTCKKGSPLTISFPHFHYSTDDPILKPYLNLFKDDSEVLDESEYEFYIDLESSLNIPINAQIVIQFNVHFRDEPGLKFVRDNYSFLFYNQKTAVGLQDFYLPAMWFKSSAQIDEANLERLKFIQKHLHLVTPITTIIMFALASILLMMSAKLAYDLTYGLSKISANGPNCKGRWNCSLSEWNRMKRNRDKTVEEFHLDSRE